MAPVGAALDRAALEYSATVIGPEENNLQETLLLTFFIILQI
jgi:hypothetical protein